jgi:hypothetical protein
MDNDSLRTAMLIAMPDAVFSMVHAASRPEYIASNVAFAWESNTSRGNVSDQSKAIFGRSLSGNHLLFRVGF